MRTLSVGSLAAVSLAASCGGVSVQSAQRPDAFTLQYVGTYQRADSTLSSVTLRRDGTYVATIGDHSESGTFASSTGPTEHHHLPLALTFSSGGTTWTGSVDGNDGHLRVNRDALPVTLAASSPVGPQEDLCEDSGGTWTDDDADDSGVYCVCPGTSVYIPSAGGCGP